MKVSGGAFYPKTFAGPRIEINNFFRKGKRKRKKTNKQTIKMMMMLMIIIIIIIYGQHSQYITLFEEYFAHIAQSQFTM